MSLRKLAAIVGWSVADLYELAGRSDQLYHSFPRQKSSGSKRYINEPLPPLKALQRRMAKEVLCSVPLPSTILGGVKGKSVRDNAALHLNQPLVVTLDIQRCFSTLRPARVADVLRRRLGASRDVRWLLTRLLTTKHQVPQGSPSSTALVNLCMLDLDDRLNAISSRFGIQHSIWVDDVAISGANAAAAIPYVEHAILELGQQARPEKTRVMLAGHDSCLVTGVVIGASLSGGRNRRELLRADILAAAKDGSLTHNHTLASLHGRVQFASMVRRSDGGALHRLLYWLTARARATPLE